MKNFLLLLVFFAFNLTAFAAVKGEFVSYVKTGDQVYFGSDLKIGLFNSKLTTADGSVIKIPNHEVESYMHDSRLYTSLPVVNNGKVVYYRMMEYVTTRGGLILYRYNDYNANTNYFVFRDGQYHLTIDSENAATVLPFFGIKNFRTVN